MKNYILLLVLSLVPVFTHSQELTSARVVLKSSTLNDLRELTAFDSDYKLPFTIYYRGRVSVGYLKPRKRDLIDPSAYSELAPEDIPDITLFKGILTRNKMPGYHVAASLMDQAFQINFSNERDVYSATIELDGEYDGSNLTASLHRVPPFVSIDGDEALYTMAAATSGQGSSGSPSQLPSMQATQGIAYDIKISALTDSQYVAIKGSAAQANGTILSIINTSETIYTNQASTRFTVVKQGVVPNGILLSNDPSTLLTQFTSYSNAFDNSNKNIGHLFTGRELTGTTIGLAFLAVVCRAPSFSYGLTQVRNNESLGALIFAHELGHNIGAEHDINTTSLMSPSLSSNQTTFSSFSLNEISSYLGEGINSLCILASDSGSGFPTYKIGKIKTPHSGNFSITANLKSGDATGCTASLYGAAKSKKLNANKIDSEGILLATVSGETGSFRVESSDIPNRLKSTSSVHFRVKASCGSSSSLSKVKSKELLGGGIFKPKAWLNNLNNSDLSVSNK